MKAPFGIALLLLFIIHGFKAQINAPFFGEQKFINGYAKALQGESLPYFSVYANYAKEALLTRCTDGKKTIEWETDAVPSATKGRYAYFTWISGFSCGTSSGTRHFDLYINDSLVLTFTTFAKQYPPFLSYAANDSTRLVLEYKRKDWANDSHGFAYLRVPLSKYPKGKALKLKVVGHAQNSNDWYMTFKYSFKERIDVVAYPFLLKNGRQPLKITVLHFGAPTTLFVQIDGKDAGKYYVQNGFNLFEAEVPAVQASKGIGVKAWLSTGYMVNENVQLKPVTYREINLVHHSHTDIGYSHIQEEVIAIHNKNIRDALKLIERTKDYPEGSRFVWNIESSWVVENFLAEASPAEKDLFFAAVKNRQIVISANYANILTGLQTPEEMQWNTLYSKKLRDEKGVSIKTAMMSDIPGMSWSVVKALAQSGVRYFSNGPNYVDMYPDKGDRIGNTLKAQANKAFWWKSTTGKDSILMWTCGKGYSSWHGTAQGAVAEKGPDRIAAYLYELDSLRYPYDLVHWRYNIVADNGPTDSSICDFVKSWNEKYASPKLVLANVTDLFERFEKKYGAAIPSYTGDFTPYWEDGAYSTAKEEAQIRGLSAKILELEKLSAQRHVQPDAHDLYQAKKNVLLFHEHTWGSWNSISAPDDAFTTHQWNYKKRFVDSAQFYVTRLESALPILASDKTETSRMKKEKSSLRLVPDTVHGGIKELYAFGKQWIAASANAGQAL